MSFVSEVASIRDASTKEEALSCAQSLLLRLQSGEMQCPSSEILRLQQSFDCVAKLLPPRKHVAILAYAIKVLGPWDPSRPVGAGSEEAIIHVSQVLAKHYQVTVFAEPPEASWWSSELSNPRYVHAWTADDYMGKFEYVVSWRHVHPKGHKYGKKHYLWLHDAPGATYNVENIDGIFFLTNDHRQSYLRRNITWNKIPSTICGNGIFLDAIPLEVPRQAKSCVYASNYARGLIHLLRCWPSIRAAHPTATLHVAYGRQTWGNLNDVQLNEIINLLNQPGITEYGKLNEMELYKLFRRCSFWTYPYSGFSETFCITAIKTQACGLIPVTTREAALAETVAPQAYTQIELDVAQYPQLLLKAMDEEESVDRSVFEDFASTFTWENVFNRWEVLHSEQV